MDRLIQGLVIRPGDTLIVVASGDVTAGEAETLGKQLGDLVPDIRVVMLECVAQLAVYRPEPEPAADAP